MAHMTMKMVDVIEEMLNNTKLNIQDNDEAFESFCSHCPYRERCGKEELFWGCSAWEEYMGEDL